MLNSTQLGKAFADETDTDLFYYMACKEESRKEAEEAFAEFYRRYVPYVLKVCLNACSDLNNYKGINGSKELAEEICLNVMNIAFEKAINFNDGNITDRKQLNARICGWLSRIAINELNQVLRKDPNIKLILAGDKKLRPPRVSKTKSPELLLIEDALYEKLDEDERDILITFHRFEQEDKYTPRDVIKELCERYDTNPDNIRQIRKRAREKVKKYFESKIKQN